MKYLFLLLIVALIACHSPRGINVNSSAGGAGTFSIDTLAKDTLLKFSAHPDLGFNFDYLVYLPKGLTWDKNTYLMVETNNSGVNDSMAHHEKGARYAASRSSVGNYVARKLKLPLLVPIFPRPATYWMYYTHALDRDALLCKDFGLERLDLQLLSMINDARKRLTGHRLILHEKFFMTGFSASGTFANRFSLLHPEKIRATASGGINGIAILPLSSFAGKALNYPLGIADVDSITGRAVNLKAYKSLPKMFYMGETDSNDAVAFDDAYSEEERALVYELMGKSLIPVRWDFIRKLYKQNNVVADFKVYPKIGHGTDLKINNELVDFFRKYL